MNTTANKTENKEKPKSRFQTINQTASALQVNKRQVHQLIKSGELTAYNFALSDSNRKLLRICVSDVERLQKGHRS